MRTVVDPSGLPWKVRRLVIPPAMRPPSCIDMLDAATPRRTVVDGARVQDSVHAPTGPVPLGVLFVPLMLPLVPFALVLRRFRLLPWTVEARAYPWGRRYPPSVFSYEVRGGAEALSALDVLADAIARGDGAPTIPGADAVDQAPPAHAGRDTRGSFTSRS